jgi:hypothetical protein
MQGVPARGAQGGLTNNNPHRDRDCTKEVSYAMAYEDLVIVAKRRNAREIGVRIDATRRSHDLRVRLSWRRMPGG